MSEAIRAASGSAITLRNNRRLVIYYVLVVIELSSRKVHIAGITNSKQRKHQASC